MDNPAIHSAGFSAAQRVGASLHDYTGAFGKRVLLLIFCGAFQRSSRARFSHVSPPVYSCKKSAGNPYFRANLQANKKARRNRRAYLHQLMSVLMASPARFERAAFRLGGERSILLSYGDMRRHAVPRKHAMVLCHVTGRLSSDGGQILASRRQTKVRPLWRPRGRTGFLTLRRVHSA